MVVYLILVHCTILPLKGSSLLWWHRPRDSKFHPRAMHSCASSRCIVLATTFLSSRCFLCASLAVLIASDQVLGNVLAGLHCVFSWCAFVPPYPTLGSFIMLPVFDQPTGRIFSWYGVAFTGLRRTPFCDKTFIKTRWRRRCVRRECFFTCFCYGHPVNGYHIIDTVHLHR